ncbi:protein phosphatase 1 regulatory subunit 3C-like [Trichosurus vulpecula]|uniref:protein phosphatase 1 regulatory subunit 3C-like n=1 Tax=Trichosurus vulpecula TaxID=9337 RepID=UPI00186B3544|nr:protein phosphatase 1 regulatory subunit 3C-like [Trichosurus vulpecula]
MPRISFTTCLSRNQNSPNGCLSSDGAELQSQLPLRPCWVRQPKHQRQKKRVVFADVKGLPLITVHNFSSDVINPKEELPPLSRMRQLMPARPTEASSYVLGFSQPLDDSSRFHQCLKAQKVCLEHCAIQGRFLQGTVHVHNLGYEKIVQMRITFNAWTSYLDVPCVYVTPLFRGEIDVFTFQVALPSGPPGPAGTIQFCFSFQCAQQLYWDNNQGCNYHLKPSDFLLVRPEPSTDGLPVFFADI